jgi:hypothetical protein
MESHMIQVQLDQARAALQAAQVQERATDTQLRLNKVTTSARRAAVRLLERDLAAAQQVRITYWCHYAVNVGEQYENNT